MRRAILAAIVVAAAGQALADPLADPALLPTDGRSAHEPAVAFGPSAGSGQGDGQYLVVWRAGRNEGADLLAARLDAAGKCLDARPITICSAKDCQEQPAVVFGAGRFLVLWADLRGGKDYDLYAARVTPDGKVLDADGLAVCAEPANQVRPAAAFDPAAKRFVVAWADFRNAKEKPGDKGIMNVYSVSATYQVFTTAVSPDGKAADPKGAAVGPLSKDESWPAVAIDAKGNVLFAGEQATALQAAGGQAQPLPWPKDRDFGERGRLLTPSAASDGAGFLVAGGDYRPIGRGGKGKGVTALLLPAGATAATTGRIGAKGGLGVLRPSVAWDGAAYLVAWGVTPRSTARPSGEKTWEAVRLSRLTPDGKLLADTLEVAGTSDGPARLPAVASDGKGSAVIVYEKHPSKPDEPIRVGVRALTAN